MESDNKDSDGEDAASFVVVGHLDRLRAEQEYLKVEINQLKLQQEELRSMLKQEPKPCKLSKGVWFVTAMLAIVTILTLMGLFLGGNLRSRLVYDLTTDNFFLQMAMFVGLPLLLFSSIKLMLDCPFGEPSPECEDTEDTVEDDSPAESLAALGHNTENLAQGDSIDRTLDRNNNHTSPPPDTEPAVDDDMLDVSGEEDGLLLE